MTCSPGPPQTPRVVPRLNLRSPANCLGAVILPSLLVACGGTDGQPGATLVAPIADAQAERPPVAPELLFRELTAWAGLGSVEPTAGVTLSDLNRDGHLDVVAPVMHRTRIFLGRGDGTFAPAPSIEHPQRAYQMVYVLDLDHDGHRDLLLVDGNGGKIARGGGDGRFAAEEDWLELSAPGSDVAAATFGDFDYRGEFDIVLCPIAGRTETAGPERGPDRGPERGPDPASTPASSSVLSCEERKPTNRDKAGKTEALVAPPRLFRWAQGRFSDLTSASHLESKPVRCKVASTFDVNDDGLLDLLVGVDGGARSQVWLNDGKGGFTELADALGVTRTMSAMGFAVADVDEDGRPDLFISDALPLNGGILYMNQGTGKFLEQAGVRGLKSTSEMTGWGLALEDFDLDGDVDLFMVNGLESFQCIGGILNDAYFENVGAGHFERRLGAAGSGLEALYDTRGAAFGDIDHDGDVDVLVGNRDGPIQLLRNELGAGQHWLQLRLEYPLLDPPTGARVTLEAGGRTQRRWVMGTASYGGSSSSDVHFGLGDATRVDQVTIRWPHGQEQRVGPLEVDRVVAVPFVAP